MPIAIPFALIFIVSIVYWWYCGIFFNNGNIWFGLCAAIVMNFIWIVLSKWLRKPSWISFYGIIWELSLIILTAAYPYIAQDMKVNCFFWLGILFAILSVFMVHLGVR